MYVYIYICIIYIYIYPLSGVGGFGQWFTPAAPSFMPGLAWWCQPCKVQAIANEVHRSQNGIHDNQWYSMIINMYIYIYINILDSLSMPECVWQPWHENCGSRRWQYQDQDHTGPEEVGHPAAGGYPSISTPNLEGVQHVQPRLKSVAWEVKVGWWFTVQSVLGRFWHSKTTLFMAFKLCWQGSVHDDSIP